MYVLRFLVFVTINWPILLAASYFISRHAKMKKFRKKRQLLARLSTVLLLVLSTSIWLFLLVLFAGVQGHKLHYYLTAQSEP